MEYVITALILLAAVVTAALVAKAVAARPFQCKHCAGKFKIKWSRALITEHTDDEYMLVCPYCKTKDWCLRQPKA